MIRLVVSNQRGGVAKTTTVTTTARVFADMGMKVLIIDTDSQGSVASILNLKPENYLYNFLVNNQAFRDCIVEAGPNVHVMCSNRRTVEAEAVFMGVTGREMAFDNVFPLEDRVYDIVLLDVAPSITLLQTCSMVYAKAILIPVAMDPLSLQGAMASIQTAASLNKLFRLNIKVAGILPVMVNRRLRMTDMILNSLDELSQTYTVPLRAVADLKEIGELPKRVKVRSSKYLNNNIEQDHRRVKHRFGPMLGLKSFRTASGIT